MLDALLATCDPGDEVVMTDPAYAGMVNRVRMGCPLRSVARIVIGHGWLTRGRCVGALSVALNTAASASSSMAQS